MKKQFLALIGGVMVAGLAMAAEVVGNNTAVVIQKTKVESSNGFQFLCVPVAPLDITGGNAGTLTLAGVLPPELYDTDTRLTRSVDDGNGGKKNAYYKIGEKTDSSTDPATTTKNWYTEAVSPSIADNETLSPGEIFWLNSKSGLGDLLPTSTLTESEDTPIVFCGQTIKNAGVVTGTPGQIVACANDSSEAKALNELITGATKGSWVYVIQNGKPDYEQYQYNGTTWRTWDSEGVPMDFTGKIAAGEAFYYYKKKVTP